MPAVSVSVAAEANDHKRSHLKQLEFVVLRFYRAGVLGGLPGLTPGTQAAFFSRASWENLLVFFSLESRSHPWLFLHFQSQQRRISLTLLGTFPSVSRLFCAFLHF